VCKPIAEWHTVLDFIILRTKLSSAVYCYQSCLCVCVFATGGRASCVCVCVFVGLVTTITRVLCSFIFNRKGGSNKLIKIFHEHSMFGFVEPLNFSTVVELIQYYQSHSLAHYNTMLDITLKFPVSRFVKV